jgi:hypothetical protein
MPLLILLADIFLCTGFIHVDKRDVCREQHFLIVTKVFLAEYLDEVLDRGRAEVHAVDGKPEYLSASDRVFEFNIVQGNRNEPMGRKFHTRRDIGELIEPLEQIAAE